MSAVVLCPKIVFFGPPQSGKTSLADGVIRILCQGDAAKVVAVEGKAADTKLRQELLPRRVLVHNAPRVPLGASLELVDCDGRAAAELLSHAELSLRSSVRSVLAEALFSADALVVVFDARDTSWEVQTTLDQLKAFFEILIEIRERDRSICGLPVFLTLTKCDALALPSDTWGKWQKRVEDRRDQLERYFTQFLEEISQQATGDLAFGSVVVHSAATALQLPSGPSFAMQADPPEGTYQLIDFTDHLVKEAVDHDRRERLAHRRLQRTKYGMSGFALALLFFAFLLFVTGGFDQANSLADRVRAYQQNEGPAKERLAERQLGTHRKALMSFRNDPAFERLPAEQQAYVIERLKEVDDYLLFRSKFQAPTLGPAEIRTNEQANQLKQTLLSVAKAPIQYESSWRETEVNLLREKWLKDLELWRMGQEQLTEHYRGLIRRANELLLVEKPIDDSWSQAGFAVLADGTSLPRPPQAELPGSIVAPGRRGQPLTYSSLYDTERVYVARRDWAATRSRLQCVLTLTEAIGLTRNASNASRAILDLSEPEAAPQQDLATRTLAALAEFAPPRNNQTDLGQATFPEWYETPYPDSLHRQIEGRLRTIQLRVHSYIRALLNAERKSESLNATDFATAARAWAARPGSGDWERLCLLFASLLNRERPAASPVQELLSFLDTEQFPMPSEVVLRLPDDLLVQRALPAGGLVVSFQGSDQPPQEVMYRLLGEGQRERPFVFYTFQAEAPLNFRTRGQVIASLALRSAGEEYRLSWESGRNVAYPFEVLNLPPRLTKLGIVPTNLPPRTTGLLSGTPQPIPALPVLFPREFAQ